MRKRRKQKPVRYWSTRKLLANIRKIYNEQKPTKALGGRTPMQEYEFVTSTFNVSATLGQISKSYFKGTAKEKARAYQRELVKQYRILTGEMRKSIYHNVRRNLVTALQKTNAPDKFVSWVRSQLRESDFTSFNPPIKGVSGTLDKKGYRKLKSGQSEKWGYLSRALEAYGEYAKSEDFARDVADYILEERGIDDEAKREEMLSKWGFDI